MEPQFLESAATDVAEDIKAESDSIHQCDIGDTVRSVTYDDEHSQPPGDSGPSTPNTTPEPTPIEPPRQETLVELIRRKRDARLAASIAREEARKAERERARAEAANPTPAPVVHAKFNWYAQGKHGPVRTYRRAHILSVHWDGIKKGPPEAASELSAVLSKSYGFTSSHVGLPSTAEAVGIMARELAVLFALRGEEDDTLIVLHYAGRSRTTRNSFYLCAPAPPLWPSAVGINMLALLCDTLFAESFQPDVLCLFDCPFAVESYGRPIEGKEILAASTEPCHFSFRHPGLHMTFTWRLAERLRSTSCATRLDTRKLEARLAEDARGESPSLSKVPGLRIGMGPPIRYILLAPVVEPFETSGRAAMDAWKTAGWCLLCGRLGRWSGMVHHCICARCGMVRGHTYQKPEKRAKMRMAG